MKYIKLIIISFLFLSLLITGLSLIFPSTVIVSRAMNMNAPKDSVIVYLKDFEGWKQWIKAMNDSSVVLISKTDANFGGTDVKISRVEEQGVYTNWTSKTGKKMTGEIHLFSNANTPNITVVQWQFEQKIKWYPWEKFASLMSDKIMGPMMEANLDELRKLVEKTK